MIQHLGSLPMDHQFLYSGARGYCQHGLESVPWQALSESE